MKGLKNYQEENELQAAKIKRLEGDVDSWKEVSSKLLYSVLILSVMVSALTTTLIHIITR